MPDSNKSPYQVAWDLVSRMNVTVHEHGEEAYNAVLRYRRGRGLSERQWQLIVKLAKWVNESSTHLEAKKENSDDASQSDSGQASNTPNPNNTELVAENVPLRLCQGCGKPIHPLRLEIMPDASLCADCQRDEEQPEKPPTPVAKTCPNCTRRALRGVMVWRTNQDGRYFLGCSNYPRCTFTIDVDEV